jgi:hypothetical protein
MGAEGQQTAKWLQIDFMKRRNTWFAISGVIILASAISLGVRGLNLGIDFKGGTQITFKTIKGFTTDDVRQVTAQSGEKTAIVQGRGAALPGGEYKQWQIRTLSLTGPAQSALSDDLRTKLGAYASGVKNVSSSFGHQIAIDAIWGIIVSLVLIVIYITLPDSVRSIRCRSSSRCCTTSSSPSVCTRSRTRRSRSQPSPRSDGARVLDLRHHHHLRPCARDDAADAAPAVRDDRQRLAVGDDPPLTRDDVHHAAADHRARNLQAQRSRTSHSPSSSA